MSRRIPFDVQFLMESILSEDPDAVYIDEEDAEILNSKGANVENMESNWEDGDAITFYIDTDENVIVFCEMKSHGEMERGLHKAASIAGDKLRFDDGFSETNYGKSAGIKSFLLPTDKLYFYGLKDNTKEGIRQYLAKNRRRFLGLNIRGGDEDIELSGRLWYSFNVISFWNEKSVMIPYMNLIEGFIAALELKPKVFAYEFIDSHTMYAYSELNQSVQAHEKLTAAQIQDKLAKKHLKKNKSDYGPEFWERGAKKAAKGFDIAAKADASIPTLEESIKFKNLINESPDEVLLGVRAARLISKGAKIKASRLNSLSSDAIPFYIDGEKNVVVFSQYKEIHGMMEYVLSTAAVTAKMDVDNNSTKFDEKFKLETMFGCVGLQMHSYKDTLIYFYGINENSINGIKKYLVENFEKLKKLKMRAIINGKEGANALCGRVWTDNSVISFWNEKSKIDPYMDLVIKFMRQLKMNTNECAYEFIDGKDLFGYDDLKRDVADIEKVSREEMNTLLKTQHLDPNAKKQLRIRGMEYPEAAVAEGRIKLKDLIQ